MPELLQEGPKIESASIVVSEASRGGSQSRNSVYVQTIVRSGVPVAGQ